MTTSPFEILGLPPSFDLTDAQIRQAYLQRAAAVHPDTTPDADPQGDSQVTQAADLNTAQSTLLDPESRAAALLRALGGPDATRDKSLPEGFLVRIMETRETIEESISSGEADRIRHARAWAQEQRTSFITRIAEMFRSLPPDGTTRQGALASIRRELNAWRYIERLVEQLDPGYDPNAADFRRHGTT